jgi:hypothetical protein
MDTVQFPEEETDHTELSASFEPDETLLECLNCDHDPDVLAFDKVLDECRDVFIKRREYGIHLNRDPAYFRMGLGVKCYRIFEDIKHGEPIRHDSLVDLVDYAVMLLTLE